MRLGETLYVLGFLALLLCLTASWVQARDVHPAPEIYTEVVGDLRVQVLAPTLFGSR